MAVYKRFSKRKKEDDGEKEAKVHWRGKGNTSLT